MLASSIFENPLTVYVAGRTSDADKVQEIQDCLARGGHTISYDWTRQGGLSPDDQFTPEVAQQVAVEEITAATTSDMTVLLWNDKGERSKLGALLEAGACLAWDKQLIILDCDRASIFWHLPNVSLMTTSEFKSAVYDNIQ